MRKLTFTFCLTIATLLTSATAETAYAEDKFYAFSKNETGTKWEAVLTIRGKTVEATLTVLDCANCYNVQFCQSY